MRKIFNKKLISVLLLVASIAIIFVVATSAKEEPTHNKDTIKKLFGVDITDIAENSTFSIIENDKVKIIDKESAIISANIYTNNIYKDAKVKTQYCKYTDLALTSDVLDPQISENNPIIRDKKCVDSVPVWIVSYENIDIVRHEKVAAHEMNVVIDAISGKPITHFIYR